MKKYRFKSCKRY